VVGAGGEVIGTVAARVVAAHLHVSLGGADQGGLAVLGQPVGDTAVHFGQVEFTAELADLVLDPFGGGQVGRRVSGVAVTSTVAAPGTVGPRGVCAGIGRVGGRTARGVAGAARRAVAAVGGVGDGGPVGAPAGGRAAAGRAGRRAGVAEGVGLGQRVVEIAQLGGVDVQPVHGVAQVRPELAGVQAAGQVGGVHPAQRRRVDVQVRGVW